MPTIKKNISIKAYNSFGIDVKTSFFCFYEKPDDLMHFITQGPLTRDTEMIILGGGSNQLFTKDFDGVIIHPVNDSLEIKAEDANHIFLKVGAGMEWDKLVAYTVKKGWGGLENLSNIPGNVGAAPVQNIGAYGVEAKDHIHAVHLVSFADGSTQTITNNGCQFAYRSSIFKHGLKNRYMVDSVTFKLDKNPTFVTHYGSVADELKKYQNVNLATIRKAIIAIRESKLPNPETIGNGGSFFKNPLVPESIAEKLLKNHPELPTYKADNQMVKLAAGWLIEQCGLKGYKNEKQTAGIHDKQALVIINLGGASGYDILQVSKLAQNKVFEKFDVCLEPEVIII
jgi:UDP-N-acetylmuramate dehydrogenase